MAEELYPKIEFYNKDERTGLDRDYRAVTDHTVQRWDQASDNANWIDIGVRVFNAEGKQIKNLDVEVTATDASQNKNLNGKNSYQYLFKTPGEHKITFKAEGLTKSVTLLAE